VPAGVVNIVHGYGPSVGPTLCGHPKVKAVSFTGGTATARHIVTQSTVGCHGPIRKMSLELGGKNAAIVFADADLKFRVLGGIRLLNYFFVFWEGKKK
jgi:acyl-CoA reductase-like NAD-dependent aldehyde dehydrogenase